MAPGPQPMGPGRLSQVQVSGSRTAQGLSPQMRVPWKPKQTATRTEVA